MGVRSVRRGVGALGAVAVFLGVTAVAGGVSPAGAACSTSISGISDPVVKEGSFFLLPRFANVVFTTDAPTQGGESITVATFDGTAVADEDYGPKVVTYTFGRNQRQRNTMVPIKGDRVDEPDEFLTVQIVDISGFCGVTADPAFSTITIVDDD